MSRVDEALKRWIKHKLRVDDASSPYWSGTFAQDDDAQMRLAGDLRVFADEYAKLRDETPIDEEWAATVRSDRVSLVVGKNGWWNLIIAEPNILERALSYFPVKLQSEVRCLLLAARIECEV